MVSKLVLASLQFPIEVASGGIQLARSFKVDDFPCSQDNGFCFP